MEKGLAGGTSDMHYVISVCTVLGCVILERVVIESSV